jgi:glycosyltransferase involved in cell wall biosynthesis
VAQAAPPELSVVIPVFNEAENIRPVLEGFQTKVSTPHEILIVHDFDEDSTVPIVREMIPRTPGLRLHRNDLGRGVLNAMKAGIAASRGPLVLISMADGSDELECVDPMVDRARAGADLVAASRYMHGGRQIGGPWIKSLLSRGAGLSLHWFGGVPIHDPTNNFKLYRRTFLDSVVIESRGGFELALELSVKATVGGHRLAEVPTTWRDRTAGTSNFKLKAWLPMYLRWYLHVFRARAARLLRRR